MTPRMQTFSRLIACAVLLAAPALLSAGAGFASSSVDFSSGDYGGDVRSETVALNFAFDRDFGPVSLGVSTSYLRITNPGVSIPGVGPVSQETIARLSVTNPRLATWLARYSASRSSPAATSSDETADGPGDTFLYGTWTFDPIGRRGWTPSLAAEIKVPTADSDKGLGTGETDYRISAGLHRNGERRGLAIDIGYRFLGDPEGFELEDGLFASLSVWRKIGDDGTLSLGLDWSAAATSETDDALELFTRYTHRFGDSLSAFAGAGTGFTDSSPDFTGSLGIEFAF